MAPLTLALDCAHLNVAPWHFEAFEGEAPAHCSTPLLPPFMDAPPEVEGSPQHDDAQGNQQPNDDLNRQARAGNNGLTGQGPVTRQKVSERQA